MDTLKILKSDKINTILLDVDGVLLDFVGHAMELMNSAMGKEFTFEHLKDEPCLARLYGFHSRGEFFQFLGTKFPHFWFEIPKLPWAMDLLDLLLSYNHYGVMICTSPQADPNSWAGKCHQLRMMGINWTQIVMCHNKYLLAKPDVLLIDDYEYNVSKFREHGGLAVQVPSNWNLPKTTLDDIVNVINSEIRKAGRLSIEDKDGLPIDITSMGDTLTQHARPRPTLTLEFADGTPREYTKEEFEKLKASGMLWEFHPKAPQEFPYVEFRIVDDKATMKRQITVDNIVVFELSALMINSASLNIMSEEWHPDWKAMLGMPWATYMKDLKWGESKFN